MLLKYSIKILNILKQNQALDKNSKKIILKIKRDKNTINIKNIKILLFINSILAKYKIQKTKQLLNNIFKVLFTKKKQKNIEQKFATNSKKDKINILSKKF